MFYRSRIVFAGLLTLFVSIVPFAGGTSSAFAATLNVCPHNCTYATIQAALSHASNGDTIHVGPGNYTGPITILTSVKLNGAGAKSTVIRGHGSGPVVTVGVFNAATGPTVAMSGVTVTGGRNTSVPDKFQPGGGGMRVESGASVTLNKSLITVNSVRSLGPGPCGTNTCSRGFGAGIANYGSLTLNSTTVSDNSNLVLDDSADFNGDHGGGIFSSATSSLTLKRSAVDRNLIHLTRSIVTADSEMVGIGGGVEALGNFISSNSSVSSNRIVVTTTTKDQTSENYFLQPLGGGLAVGGSAVVNHSRIDGNAEIMSAYSGIASASGGGIEQEAGSLLLENSDVSRNSLSDTTTSTQTTAGASTDGGPWRRTAL